MINKICKTSGFKLPKMSPLKVKQTNTTPSHEERQLANARKNLEEVARKQRKKNILKPMPPVVEGLVSDAAPKQTVSSSGGLTPDERAEAVRLLDSTRDTYVNVGSKRVGKMVDGKVVFENVPVSKEEGLKNWEQEGKSNFYVDFDKDGNAFVKSVPRGDDDIPVQSFLKGLDSSQYRGDLFSDLPTDYQDPGLIPGHPLNPNEGYHRVDNFRN